MVYSAFMDMSMSATETQLPYLPDLERARISAISEAADTGSTVMRIRAIQPLCEGRVLFVGTIPIDALEAESAPPGRLLIRPRGLGNLYIAQTAMGNLADPIGFLVLHHPLKFVRGQMPDDGEFVSVALEAARPPLLTPGLIGPVCCNCCNQPIPDSRLKVMPGIKVCTKCQSLKEKTQ